MRTMPQVAAEALPKKLEWSPARVMSGIALAAWAGLFWFLLLGDRTSLYLSSRTDWVIPVGALILTVASVGRLLTARASRTEPVEPRDAWGLVLVVFPVVTVLALPPASLGNYAASRRSNLATGSFSSSAQDISSGELSLVDVSTGVRTTEGMRALVARAGSEVSFTGFVTRESGMPVNEFLLTRFLISCCVADALSAQVRVVGAPPGRFEADDWVRVEGAMYPLGREVIVKASSVTRVPRPKRPYLNP